MITNIRLQNFRSYKDASFEFEPGANIIVGPNASGKTNLLEAIMVLARASSFRTKDINLIKHGAPWARIDGFFEKHNRVVKLEKEDDNINKTLLIDDRPYKRLNLDRSLPLVYFEPEHLQSLTKGPERRRDFFDDLLERSRPGYKQLLASYRRSLAQRNALLKSSAVLVGQQVFVWDVRLGELGSKVATARNDLAEGLNKKIPDVYSQVAGKKTRVRVEYTSQLPLDNYASQLVKHLGKNLQRDLTRGFTGDGPHREDFSLFINDRPIDITASRGEVRTLLLSLKKLELNIIEKARDQKPILLLDDVLSELDGLRRQALVSMLADHQAILTTTDADTVLDYFARGSHKLLAINK